jgi:hypothetical protein
MAVGIRCADHATPSIRKVGTNFVDMRRSVYSLAEFSFIFMVHLTMSVVQAAGQLISNALEIMWMYSAMILFEDSSVGIATGYGLDGGAVGVRVLVGVRISISPCRPYRLWGPPSLLSYV